MTRVREEEDHMTCSSCGLALKFDPSKWSVPLAGACPTADRSRTVAQKRGLVSCWTCML